MKKITEEMVEYWLGSDDKFSEAISTLTDIANGDYKVKTFNRDIAITCEGVDFEDEIEK